jgi:hypothetical protein
LDGGGTGEEKRKKGDPRPLNKDRHVKYTTHRKKSPRKRKENKQNSVTVSLSLILIYFFFFFL